MTLNTNARLNEAINFIRAHEPSRPRTTPRRRRDKISLIHGIIDTVGKGRRSPGRHIAIALRDSVICYDVSTTTAPWANLYRGAPLPSAREAVMQAIHDITRHGDEPYVADALITGLATQAEKFGIDILENIKKIYNH